MRTLEIFCLAIVVVYLVTRALKSPAQQRVDLLIRYVAIAAAGFVGETTMIAAYKTYAYSTLAWSTFIDRRVPLVIVLVWPVVIDSAIGLARAACSSSTNKHERVPLLTALIVLADAALIEPIAVRAKLWTWTESGVFDVPLIGIAGWAMFTFFVTWLLEQQRRRPTRASIALLLIVLLAPLLTHAAVLISWWSVFRWAVLRSAIDPTLLVLAAAASSVIASLVAARSHHVSPSVVLERAPGAIFFFMLLALEIAPPTPALLLYALAFAVPYFIVLLRPAKSLIFGPQ